MQTVRVLVLACAVLLLCQAVHGATSLSVDGNAYEVWFLCLGDAGDYCTQRDLGSDQFIFEDGDFGLKGFEDDLLGLSGSGSYSEQGATFQADYEVIDDSLDKYTFEVRGFGLTDDFIAGAMTVSYAQWEIFDYEEEEQAAAYFLGIKR